MEFDLVVANGSVIDGTGAHRFKADEGTKNGKTSRIARGSHLSGENTIDATGIVLAPGFIDLHSHSDWTLPLADRDEILAPSPVLQGITTVAGAKYRLRP